MGQKPTEYAQPIKQNRKENPDQEGTAAVYREGIGTGAAAVGIGAETLAGSEGPQDSLDGTSQSNADLRRNTSRESLDLQAQTGGPVGNMTQDQDQSLGNRETEEVPNRQVNITTQEGAQDFQQASDTSSLPETQSTSGEATEGDAFPYLADNVEIIGEGTISADPIVGDSSSETSSEPDPDPNPNPDPTPNVIIGTEGDDKLRGTKEADLMEGLEGQDKIIGRGGDDVLKGGAGDDILKGGAGDDLLYGGEGDDIIRGGKGQDTVVFDHDIGDYKITKTKGGLRVEDLTEGGEGTDIIKNNVESFQFGDTTYSKAQVMDHLIDPNMTVRVSNATDNQTAINSEDGYNLDPDRYGTKESVTGEQMDIKGASKNAEVSYTFQDDNSVDVELNSNWNSVKNVEVTSKHAGDVALDNFVHTDVTLGSRGGGDSTVEIDGAKRGDISTGRGDDTIDIDAETNNSGWSNKFNIDAGRGDDTINLTGDKGHTEADIQAGGGHDSVTLDGDYKQADVDLGKGHDRFTGGDGEDRVEGGRGHDDLSGGGGDDELFGGKGKDQLFGGSGDDELYGGSQRDYLEGGAGDDLLSGDAGKDILSGGEGADDLYGGQGGDVFVFDSLTDSTEDHADVIHDFHQGQDKIDVSSLEFDSLVEGDGEGTSLGISITEDGQTVINNQDSNFSITLDGVYDTLSEDDFIFGNGD